MGWECPESEYVPNKSCLFGTYSVNACYHTRLLQLELPERQSRFLWGV